MQNEDDLRGLAKVTDFMRAISFYLWRYTSIGFVTAGFTKWAERSV